MNCGWREEKGKSRSIGLPALSSLSMAELLLLATNETGWVMGCGFRSLL
jgi:hypothetical protein